MADLRKTAVSPHTMQGAPAQAPRGLAQTALDPLRRAYEAYQRSIGQPFQQAVRGGVRGYFGLPIMSDASATGREAYRQGEALGYTPGVGMPAGAVRVAAEGMQALPAVAGEIGRVISAMPSLRETVELQKQAANDAAKAARIATFGKTEEELMAGLRQAQANNNYMGSSDPRYKSQYGRMLGVPQPKDTPPEKLFSNFADTEKFTPQFREAMFGRALKTDFGAGEYTPLSTVIPYKDQTQFVIESSGKGASKGKTRVQIVQDGKPIAAARIENGMLDSIAVTDLAKGKNIGYDLLKFLHTNNIANVLEVPDRSPGFIKIQKRLVQELQQQK
jgi:hypothetical protein